MALTEEQINEIRKETGHLCDVYTDGDWFTEKVAAAVNEHLTEYLTKVVVALLAVVDLDEQAQETVGYFRAED